MDTSSEGTGSPRGETDRILGQCEEVDPGSDDLTSADAGERWGGPRHYSTGKLTAAQARVVDGWRRQLTVPDRRFRTPNHRPPASSSDCVATAIIHLLDHAEPTLVELIRYGARMREDLALSRGRTFPAASAVSFYLPGVYSTRVNTMLTDAHSYHTDLLYEARAQVLGELPGRQNAAARALRMASAVAELGVPLKAYRLPAGTLARLAIDRWARKATTTVVLAAVAHGAAHHQQQHRARHDMGIGEPRH